MRTDIGTSNGNIPSTQTDQEYDVVVVGGGFSGCYLLHTLRKAGFKVLLLEAAPALGGVWQWNRYPGARVDTHAPLYSLAIPEVYNTWNWTQRFPSHYELRDYFQHVDKVLSLSKDCIFNTKVTEAVWDDTTSKWTVHTEHGARFMARYWIPCLGFAANRVFPKWPGIENFKGEIHHSSFWPSEQVDVRNKRVAVIGTGATGVQIVQETGPQARQLTVFQRTPNTCCPLRQKNLTVEEQEVERKNYRTKYAFRYLSEGGYDFSPAPVNTFDHSEEDRRAFFEERWAQGGFLLWSGGYQDVLTNPKANREVFEFWKEKIRPLIDDPAKRELLAPQEPPHPFGAKRTALYTTFYEVMNQPNVDIVDVKSNPISHLTDTGIVTKDGKLHEFDIIALATGFDAITGGLKQINIRNSQGKTLNQKWNNGTKTHLGLMVREFPNMFFSYGPHGPTGFSNGPTAIELQGDWIRDLLERARESGWKSIQPTAQAETRFSKLVNDLTFKTLIVESDSYWVGGNVEGKKKEGLNFPGGVPLYNRLITESASKGYADFEVV
ncbi:unnamed protein product [Clonostachys byssicola]|uniref:FAD/NAD(P)-binding domain-containing protein n=1 Tax=Clonostachys byssicola TaxID=160290 RepID=A0A9N9Y4R9_9HYPO|nr:unnamed protein product [Clonostachys byssicola]